MNNCLLAWLLQQRFNRPYELKKKSTYVLVLTSYLLFLTHLILVIIFLNTGNYKLSTSAVGEWPYECWLHPAIQLTSSRSRASLRTNVQTYLPAEGWPDRPAAARRSEGSSWPIPPRWRAVCRPPDRCSSLDRWAAGRRASRRRLRTGKITASAQKDSTLSALAKSLVSRWTHYQRLHASLNAPLWRTSSKEEWGGRQNKPCFRWRGLKEEIPAESCRRTNNIPQTDALRGPFSPHTNHPCGQLVGPGRGPKLQNRRSTQGTGNNLSANKNGHIFIINATHTHL